MIALISITNISIATMYKAVNMFSEYEVIKNLITISIQIYNKSIQVPNYSNNFFKSSHDMCLGAFRSLFNIGEFISFPYSSTNAEKSDLIKVWFGSELVNIHSVILNT